MHFIKIYILYVSSLAILAATYFSVDLLKVGFYIKMNCAHCLKVFKLCTLLKFLVYALFHWVFLYFVVMHSR